MVVPVGNKEAQTLVMVRREPDGVHTTPIGDARFVPLLGEFGFRPT
jgi:protein-L-isoaspartate O-methyltransferase